MKKNKTKFNEVLKLDKIQISKLDNLNAVKGGNGSNSGVDWTKPPTKSGNNG